MLRREEQEWLVKGWTGDVNIIVSRSAEVAFPGSNAV